MKKENFIKNFCAVLSVAFASTCTTAVLPFYQNTEVCAAEESELIVYNLNELPVFKDRTKEMISKKYSEGIYKGDTYINQDENSYYEIPASTVSPYNQGKLTQDTVKSMQGMTDFYRWLVGVNELKVDCVPSDYLQYQALDRNFEWNHFISMSSKPSDMDDELWQKGYECNHNILAWGYTPRGAVYGWMNEGYSLYDNTWDTFGHRYSLISAKMSEIQFGYVDGVALGDSVAYDNDDQKDAVYAFPSPGYMPDNVISPGSSAWNVDFDTSVMTINDISKSEVTVTNLRTGNSYTCTYENDKLHGGDDGVRFVQPSDYNEDTYRYEDSYSVVITGVTDVASGKEAEIRYTVDFYDSTPYTPSYTESATCGFDDLVIIKEMNNKTSLEKVAAALPRKILVTAETGYITEIETDGAWTLDEENKCFRNTADSSKLPELLNDKFNVLKNIRLNYRISESDFDYYNGFWMSGDTTEGGSCQMYVYRTDICCPATKVFKVTKQNGKYIGEEKYCSEYSPEFDLKATEENPPCHVYTINNLKKSDSGEYFSVYYEPNYLTSWGTSAYLSTSFYTLDVKDKPIEPDSVKLSKSALTLESGKTQRLTATIAPTNAADKTITWTSSNTRVATVSNGTVRAVKAGTATITAKTVNGKTASCKVTVKAAAVNASSVKLNKTRVTLAKGKTSTLKATITPSTTTNKKLTWTTSNKKIATVDSKGKVKAIGKGTATITVRTANGKKATCKVTVTIPSTKVKLNKTKATLKVGKSLSLKATMTPNNSTDKLTWSSSDKKIATVKNGKVTAKKAGTVTITVKTSSGKTAKCRITVKKK